MTIAISLDFIYPPAHLLRVDRRSSRMSRKSGNSRHPISCLAGRTCLTTIRSPARKWASNLPVSHRVGHSVLAVDNEATDDVADIYNQAGDDYVSYADGDPSRPFAFDGMHAYADRCVWAVLEKKLTDLRASGANSVRLLDAGCGPVHGCGDWSYAHMRSDSAASPRVDSTSHRRKYNGRGCDPKSF